MEIFGSKNSSNCIAIDVFSLIIQKKIVYKYDYVIYSDKQGYTLYEANLNLNKYWYYTHIHTKKATTFDYVIFRLRLFAFFLQLSRQ